MQRGAEIKILLARKNNVFLKDIVRLETETGIHSPESTIDTETETIHHILTKIQKEQPYANLEVRYYSKEKERGFV